MLDRYSPEFYDSNYLHSIIDFKGKIPPTVDYHLPLKGMTLEQLKSQASFDQKFLIEKVENLVRSEYNR